MYTRDEDFMLYFNGLKTTDKSNFILAIWPAPASPLADAAVIWFTAVEPSECWSLRSYQIRDKRKSQAEERRQASALLPQRGDEAIYSPRCRKFSSMPLQEFLVIKDLTRPHGCFLYFTSVYTLIMWQSKIQLLRRINVKVRLIDNMVNYTNNVWWRYTLHQIKQSLCISLH